MFFFKKTKPVEQPVAKPKSKGKKIVKEPIAEPIVEPIAEPIAKPTESVKIKDKVKCPDCDKEMNANTLSYNHKHICPKKQLKQLKKLKIFVVSKIKTFTNQRGRYSQKINYML